MDEFDFIASLIRPLAGRWAEGLRDDCAWVEVDGKWLVVSTDTSVEAVHFPRSVKGAAATERAVRVALSDIYAKGAEPIGYLAAISVPSNAPDIMMRAYAAGFEEASRSVGVPLIGGDTVKHEGLLSVTITAFGWAPRKLLRSGAQPGDNIWLSGAVGEASLGLRNLQGDTALPNPTGEELVAWEEAFLRPGVRLVPELAEATAAIDVSDGLLRDAKHIADESGVCCELRAANVPFGHASRLANTAEGIQALASAGDDYVVLFTAEASKSFSGATKIGSVVSGAGVRLLDQYGGDITPNRLGYTHDG